MSGDVRNGHFERHRIRLHSSAMVGCRRVFLDWGNRRWVLFVGKHSYRSEWLATGFVIAAARLALLTRRHP